ncbi:YbaB/EbfC family nucleoid-associated protein [Actinoplanes sp. NPDC049596]|uniref:YbaB/EbfC family nucleoid-associated protein n=1 Tax=unclassified Actinoplanes TaxID=2626549 RepID=UPI0034125F0B
MSDELIDGLALERIEQWQQGFEERAARARTLSERTSGLSATAREADGIIEVTVGSGGQITDLRLDDEIQRQPAATTARQILAAIAAAKASLARDFAQVTAETVGLDSATGQAMMKSLNDRLGLAGTPPEGPAAR